MKTVVSLSGLAASRTGSSRKSDRPPFLTVSMVPTGRSFG
jgi:hypothetical protein